VQRKCACGGTPGPTGECEACRKKDLQRRGGNRSAPDHFPSSVPEVPPIVHEVLRSPGEALDAKTRAFMEPRFGHDFGQVRVHSDAKAAQSARAINAWAYTVGARVIFGDGQYAPHLATGQRLIAHELAHVVQQSSIPNGSGTKEIRVLPDNGPLEDEARMAETTATEGHSAAVSSRVVSHEPKLSRAGFFENLFSQPGQAFARLFGEGDFSEKELQDYLAYLRTQKTIENDYDSDNKARAVVSRWKARDPKVVLTPSLKSLLIQEMDKGSVGSGDQEHILDLLEPAEDADLRMIFGSGGVNAQTLLNDFGDAPKKRLAAFYERRFKGGLAALNKGEITPVGASAGTGQLNDETFRVKWEAALQEGLAKLEKSIEAGGCAFPSREVPFSYDTTNWKLGGGSNLDQLMGTTVFQFTGKSASDAVEALFNNLGKWTCDCRLFPEIALLYAWRGALKDKPDAFNTKFANLTLSAEDTTGLDREVNTTDDDVLWKDAPVGTKVVWENTSSVSKPPWTHEHAIKVLKAPPKQEDRYDAHPLGFNLTEKEVKVGLARACADFPWPFKLTATSIKELGDEGLSTEVTQTLESIKDQEFVGMKDFLNSKPLFDLRLRVKEDREKFEPLVNRILKKARHEPQTKAEKEAEETYVADNIKRMKLEVMK
jgi:hypothetical protein